MCAPSASAKLLVLPAWLLPARPEIAPVKMPNIAAPVDYATLLDREQAAFDAAEFTPATADPDAPPPDVGFGSTRNPLVVQLRNLRRRAYLSRVRGKRWDGTDDVNLVTTYNTTRNAAQERRRRANLTPRARADVHAERVQRRRENNPGDRVRERGRHARAVPTSLADHF